MVSVNSYKEELERENQKVAYWLLNYHEEKRKCEAQEKQAIWGHEHASVLRPCDGAVQGDPIGNATAKLVDDKELQETKAWLALVEEVESRLSWEMRVFLRLRREAKYRKGRVRGRPAWVPYVQHKFAQEVARRRGKDIKDVWVSAPETFMRWWRRLVDYTARQAAKRGLLE